MAQFKPKIIKYVVGDKSAGVTPELLTRPWRDQKRRGIANYNHSVINIKLVEWNSESIFRVQILELINHIKNWIIKMLIKKSVENVESCRISEFVSYSLAPGRSSAIQSHSVRLAVAGADLVWKKILLTGCSRTEWVSWARSK